jgi:uncharacterized protein YlzI (FlbEa/FlbD family)
VAAEIKAVIVLANGTELRVQEDGDEVRKLIDDVTSRHIAQIDVTDANGVFHHVNAHQIVEWHAAG